uniref:Uncharacterized protein n=3 Tax=Phasianidae TaxID=9005 RepID=A0A803YE42_MELGA
MIVKNKLLEIYEIHYDILGFRINFCLYTPQILIIFPLHFFFSFLDITMFLAIVCVRTCVHVIYVAVIFVSSSCNLHFSPILNTLVWQPKLL